LDRADGVAPDHPVVLLERAAQAAAGLATSGEPRIIESQADPYARAGVGLSLLGLAAATGGTASPSRAPGEGMVLLRGALVGLAIALVTALAVPRLGRARG